MAHKRFFLAVLFVLTHIQAQCQQNKQLQLWYDHQASLWEEAIPVGNGSIGAMIFGNTDHEVLQLNHNTLWSGYPNPGNNPNGPVYLPLVRRAVNNGDYLLAGQYWKKMQGPYSARYLPMADLHIHFRHDARVSDYRRTLSLNDAISTVSYHSNGVTFKREIFTSYPDQLLVMRLTASKKKQISLTASLNSKLKFNTTLVDHRLMLRGKAPIHVAHRDSEPLQIIYDEMDGEGIAFSTLLEVRNEGGIVEYGDSTISVKNADAVTLYLTAGTSFNGFDKSPGLKGKDPVAEPLTYLQKITTKSYEAIRTDHIKDYQGLFNRVNFEVEASIKKADVPTDERLRNYYSGSQDHNLAALYYQFGRYLLISCSRPGSPPANLQGMWNPHIQPPWGSNYTTNINTEMNYWLAESTNLSECHFPLLSFIRNLAINGAETAKINYGVKEGWCAHHNSDIWAKTSPPGGFEPDPRSRARWSCWPMAGAWMSTHLWEHYQYTGDEKFLREEAWPLMRGAAEFLLSWLQENPDGYLVTNPSTSPENVFRQNGTEMEISMATTMDIAITRELFRACLRGAEKIGNEAVFQERIRNALEKLYPYHIGMYGQLQEWFKDWDDPNDKHRHISHLFGLHPGSQLSPIVTPELTEAAKKSLIQRGDVSTGWSMAWKINWWARLGDGNHAFSILKEGLRYVGPKDPDYKGGGTYPNLFDAHPPFQIDGNFGGTAGMTEMLMQSHLAEIHILPALPNEWKGGFISGIMARGGFETSIHWKNQKVDKVTITSLLGGNCRVRSNVPLRVVETPYADATGENPNPLMTIPTALPFVNSSLTEITPEVQRSFVIDFQTEKGKTYTLLPK